MFVRRRKGAIKGIYQATCFTNKPPNSSGLRTGGYFVSLEACNTIQTHYASKSNSNERRRRKPSSQGRSSLAMCTSRLEANAGPSSNSSLIISTEPFPFQHHFQGHIVKEQSDFVAYPCLNLYSHNGPVEFVNIGYLDLRSRHSKVLTPCTLTSTSQCTTILSQIGKLHNNKNNQLIKGRLKEDKRFDSGNLLKLGAKFEVRTNYGEIFE
jgi:hypothetical protein